MICLVVTNIAVLKIMVLLKVQLVWSFENSTPNLFILNHAFACHPGFMIPWYCKTAVPKQALKV
jgi:hypothetical protein